MAKPFTSYDGVDPQGVRAEVHVQTGTGTIKALVENGNNVQVQMNVEGLKHPVQGWTSKSEKIYPMLVEAKEQGREVSYRIESQRKQGIDRSIPIEVLRETMDKAKENTRNLFVGIDGTLSTEAVTDPAEDPYAGGRIPATDPRNKPQGGAAAAGGPGGFSVEQALTGLANARQGGLPQSIVDSAAALALAAGASVQQVLSAGVTEQNDDAPRPVQRAVAAEAAPHVQYNTDGRLNLGSYAVQAAVGSESLASDLLHANAVEVAERHNAAVEAGETAGDPVEVQPVNFKQAAALGGVLLDLADRVQVAAYGGGRPNRMANSHTRARAFVYDAVKNRYPVPFGQDAQAQEDWKEKVVEESMARFERVIRLLTGETEAPQEQPQTDAPAQQERPGQEQPQTEAPAQPGQQADPTPRQTDDTQPGQQDGQVRHIGNAAQAKGKPPVEGEEGFVAPDAETVQRFAALAHAAGFEATPDSPVLTYLNHKFGVTAARKVHGGALAAIVDWYGTQGAEAGPAKFRQHVLAEAGTDAESA